MDIWSKEIPWTSPEMHRWHHVRDSQLRECNFGNNLDALEEMGKQVYGIDPIEEVLIGGVGRARATAFALPFPDNSFDLVLCAGVLCHISPSVLAGALNEIRRVCGKCLAVIDYEAIPEKAQRFRDADFLWRRDIEQCLSDYSTLNKLESGLTDAWDKKNQMKYMVYEKVMR